MKMSTKWVPVFTFSPLPPVSYATGSQLFWPTVYLLKNIRWATLQAWHLMNKWSKLYCP